jgi:hypothetical protein
MKKLGINFRAKTPTNAAPIKKYFGIIQYELDL